MNKWIVGATLACGLVIGQFAQAQQFNGRDYSHAWLQDQRSPAHGVSSRANSHERIIIGGYIDERVVDRHDKNRHRRIKHRRDRHTQQRYYEYDRGHKRHHRRHRHHHRDQHDENCYYRPQRRITRVIRSY